MRLRLTIAWLVALLLSTIVFLDFGFALTTYGLRRFMEPTFWNGLPWIGIFALFMMCLIMVDGIKVQLQLRKELKDVRESQNTSQPDDSGEESALNDDEVTQGVAGVNTFEYV